MVLERHADAFSFRVRDATDAMVGLQRARESAVLQGLPEADRATVLTVISELASNIHKHAGRGAVRVERAAGSAGIEVRIEATDDGPGIADVALAMRDHFSTAGTLGLGLPGVRRMAQDFSITSMPGGGTAVRATVRCSAGAGPRPAPATAGILPGLPARSRGWDIGQSNRPCPGERESGDAVLACPRGDALLLAVVDGTGHGAAARAAAMAVQAVADGGAWSGLPEFLQQAHARLAGTRGAAVGALLVDGASRRFSYAGVGNTTASREVGEPWRGVSRDGVLGERLPTAFVQEGVLSPGDLFVLCTDGVSSLDRASMPGRAARRDASGLAQDIVSEYGRPHDDASCLVARWGP
jgi:anti-sigma regulatory factor (Ser/Thr protein kinase)